jgi:hypothetical protein
VAQVETQVGCQKLRLSSGGNGHHKGISPGLACNCGEHNRPRRFGNREGCVPSTQHRRKGRLICQQVGKAGEELPAHGVTNES